jgi:ATP-dependent Lon protease
MNSNNSNSKNPLNPPNPDNFFNKKNKKRKNKRQIQLQMNEEYENYLESTNKKDSMDNLTAYSKSTNDLTKLTGSDELSLLETRVEKKTKSETKSISSPKKQIQHKNFYKNQSVQSLNNLKVKEMKESIRKNSSCNIIGDIVFELSNQLDNTSNSITLSSLETNHQIKKIKSSHSFHNSNPNQENKRKKISSQNLFELADTNGFEYLIGEGDVDISIDESVPSQNTTTNNNTQTIGQQNNRLSNKKNKKQNQTNQDLDGEKSVTKFEDIVDLDLKINNTIDYHLINTPFKIIGEELLNEEINNKYKPKAKINPENNQIIKKLKDVFKKLVYKELKEKPNISQMLLDNELTDELKVKILRKYIKFNTEDEVFSEEADKIKIEIKNLLKQKKLRKSDDFEELGIMVENKIVPPHLKQKLEDMYYRVIGGDQPKLHNLLTNILKLPFEKKPNIFDTITDEGVEHEKKVEFVKNLYKKLDSDLYGLEETKDSIMSWICQKINNPNQVSSKYLCLCGPAGVGKTSIVHSISESLEIPYSYISLANIDEPGSLIGHGYTYEGSQCGSVANGLIANGCVNGILLFDEIDKAKEKVQSTLLGIFDPLQNKKFRDAYFGEFYLNLSESLMIICLNDLDKVNPILRDRLHIVHIPGYTIKDKKVIVKNYILPKLKSQYNISIDIEEKVIDEILENTKNFQGIRQIQSYFIKIYELVVLDKYISKYNFNNNFTIKNINLLKMQEPNNAYLNMFT